MAASSARTGRRARRPYLVAAVVTGNIQIHEMAWGAGNELWVVNTRFSCLCTLDGSASFAPRWRPPFVSALEPTDRCHLNGMCVVDDEVRIRDLGDDTRSILIGRSIIDAKES